MKFQTGAKQAFEQAVDGVVIAVQKVDPGADPGLDLTHEREIALRFNRVVAVEVLKEGLKRRNELPMQVYNRQAT